MIFSNMNQLQIIIEKYAIRKFWNKANPILYWQRYSASVFNKALNKLHYVKKVFLDLNKSMTVFLKKQKNIDYMELLAYN